LLNKSQQFALVSAANILSGLLEDHHVRSLTDFEYFRNIETGMPVLIPADPHLFDFEANEIFEIDPLEVIETLYGISDQSYIGFKHAFGDNYKFLSTLRIRKEHKQLISEVTQNNIDAKLRFHELSEQFPILGAFQTRNIPHLGHERIMTEMLQHCDHLVVNPVVGPKKLGDISFDGLQLAYEYLSKNKYDGRISFFPIRANMYYAGPREAVHHTKLRQYLGFKLFSVGRDHAGAGAVYHPNDAQKIMQKVSNLFNIKVITHSGAEYCKECGSAIIGRSCLHKNHSFEDISGSEFRRALQAKSVYSYADLDLQSFLSSSAIRIFEND